jgi:hypothetical protein
MSALSFHSNNAAIRATTYAFINLPAPPLNRHSPDSRQFEARIAPLIGLGNGKFRLARARGGRSWRWRDQDC